MTTPTSIAFEPSTKPSPSRRDKGADGDSNSFADSVQAQHDADRSAKAPRHGEATNGAKKTGAGGQAGQQTGQDAGTNREHGTRSGSAANTTSAAGSGGDDPIARGHSAERATAAATLRADAKSAATPPGQATAASNTVRQAASAGSASGSQAATEANTVWIVRQQARSGPTNPVHGATALAAQTADSAMRGTTHTQAQTNEDGSPSSAKVVPSAGTIGDRAIQAFKDTLAGTRDLTKGPDHEPNADGRNQRAEARSSSQLPARNAMGPAVRAASEALQQQLSASASTPVGQSGAEAGSQVSATTRTSADGGPPASALPGSAQSQAFDPVLQNSGPQPGGSGQPGSLTAAGKAAPTAGTGTGNPAPATPPSEQIAVQIQRAAAQGQSRVQIRLHPAELGRIDVKMEVSDEGHVRAVLAVDKPETLDLMQRDLRALEKALQAAGLKTDSGSLSFNLRDDGRQGDGESDLQGEDLGSRDARSATNQDSDDADMPVPTRNQPILAQDRVDIRI